MNFAAWKLPLNVTGHARLSFTSETETHEIKSALKGTCAISTNNKHCLITTQKNVARSKQSEKIASMISVLCSIGLIVPNDTI